MTLLSIAKHASKYGILPLKYLGQNFIFDSSLCDKIVKVADPKANQIIVEIGPGTAGLTRSILSAHDGNVTVVETDKRCWPLLEEIKNFYPNLNIIQGDALEFDLANLNSTNINIISNLPYNIGTELLVRWLKKIELIDSMTLMLQKEVVDRISSLCGNKQYGRLSIICQLTCQVKKCFEVSSAAFYPPPNVQSAIIKLTPLSLPPPKEMLQKVELITKFAFGQRRKMLKSSLKPLSENISSIFEKTNILPTSRAEDLSPADYLKIASFI